MLGELVGGLTSVAWTDLQFRYQYGFGSPYASLAAGKGLAHPGILNVGPIRLGEWSRRAVLAHGTPGGFRKGVAKFLRGGTYGEKSLGFDPTLLTRYHGANLSTIGMIEKAGRAPAGTMDLVGHARFVRGAALGLRALSIASVVAVAAPLAYSAG